MKHCPQLDCSCWGVLSKGQGILEQGGLSWGRVGWVVKEYLVGRLPQLNHKWLTCEIPHTLRETKYPPNSRLLTIAALLFQRMNTVYQISLLLQHLSVHTMFSSEIYLIHGNSIQAKVLNSKRKQLTNFNFQKTSVLPPDVRTNYSSSLSPTTISRVMRGVGGGWIWGS